MASGARPGASTCNGRGCPPVAAGQSRDDYRAQHGDDAYHAAVWAGAFTRSPEHELRVRHTAYEFATGARPSRQRVAAWQDELGVRRHGARNSCHRQARPARTRRPGMRVGRAQRATRAGPDDSDPHPAGLRRRGAGWETPGVEQLVRRRVCGRRVRR